MIEVTVKFMRMTADGKSQVTFDVDRHTSVIDSIDTSRRHQDDFVTFYTNTGTMIVRRDNIASIIIGTEEVKTE